MLPETRRILRNMQRVQRFPWNTCPASRHAALIAESLARSKDPDRENEGASIASAVASLWKLRTKLKESGDAGEKAAAICGAFVEHPASKPRQS